MKKLQALFADKNQITDLSPLKNLSELSHLGIWGNEIWDWSPVAHVDVVNK
jgi:Leucine-rich repeat (LRR) protein